ncbi:MAG: 3-oxoacyl-[acyl-carrier-protein] synthase III C-terminal domain-containing protein [Chlamydiales bacterium]
MNLADFEIMHPPYHREQEEGMKWLAALHTEAEKTRKPSIDPSEFRKIIDQKIAKVGCKKDKISRRFTVLKDMMHEEWDQMELYNIHARGGEGSGFGEKGRFYETAVDKIFDQFYPEKSLPPDELIHVTCTGYNAPSSPQKLVVRRGWEKTTQVTHAYHMGCMAAMPAVRIALGFAARGIRKIDVVHTELCTLHINPVLHTDEQLVAQSLFSDGMIKYTLTSENENKPQLRVLTVYEELIPNSEKLMKWVCKDWGMQIALDREIPLYISQSIGDFVKRLEQKSGHPLQNAIFAIHPGGPKIVDLIRRKLSLSQQQVATTQKILYHYGNMSSATIPHIWEAILDDAAYCSGTLIVSLAFGPGLCVCGCVMEKI